MFPKGCLITSADMNYQMKKYCDHTESFKSRTNFRYYNKDEPNFAFPKIFDWTITAKIINETQIQNASVALDTSIEKTHAILKNGKPFKSDDNMSEYRVNNPVLIDDDTGQIINCFSHVNRENKDKASNITTSNTDGALLRWPKKQLISL